MAPPYPLYFPTLLISRNVLVVAFFAFVNSVVVMFPAKFDCKKNPKHRWCATKLDMESLKTHMSAGGERTRNFHLGQDMPIHVSNSVYVYSQVRPKRMCCPRPAGTFNGKKRGRREDFRHWGTLTFVILGIWDLDRTPSQTLHPKP